MKLVEMFDSKVDYKEVDDDSPRVKRFEFMSNADKITIRFTQFRVSWKGDDKTHKATWWELGFARILPNGDLIDGTQDSATHDSIKVFSGVSKIADEFIRANKVNVLFVECKASRVSSYTLMLRKLSSKIGFKLISKSTDAGEFSYMQKILQDHETHPSPNVRDSGMFYLVRNGFKPDAE